MAWKSINEDRRRVDREVDVSSLFHGGLTGSATDLDTDSPCAMRPNLADSRAADFPIVSFPFPLPIGNSTSARICANVAALVPNDVVRSRAILPGPTYNVNVVHEAKDMQRVLPRFSNLQYECTGRRLVPDMTSTCQLGSFVRDSVFESVTYARIVIATDHLDHTPFLGRGRSRRYSTPALFR